MDVREVFQIAKYLEGSWPNQELDPALVKVWAERGDFKALDFAIMVLAIDNLRANQEHIPNTKQLLEAYRSARWATEKQVQLPAHVEQRSEYGIAWALLTATWQHLYSRVLGGKAAATEKKWFMDVSNEVGQLKAQHQKLFPPDPDAKAPDSLVKLAVEAKERVRKMIFEATS